MSTEQLLLALLRAVLCGETVTEPITLAQFKAVYKLAAKHDLAHLVYTAVKSCDALPQPTDDAERAFLDSMEELLTVIEYRYAKLDAELTHVRQVFEREGIPYVPLKGAVMRVLYPQPWMRTSCDIDILVHGEDFDRAVAALVAEGYETDGVRGYHDQLLCCDDVQLELHHNVLERQPQMDALLSQIWEHTVSKGCQHLETPDFFLFHHIAHTAYHFQRGGCGVRSVIDLYLLRESGRIDDAAVRALCEQAGLLTFYDKLCRLADAWFGGGERDGLTDSLESYILRGGLFGTRDQRSTANAARHGRLGFLWYSVFMPYRDLKQLYPALEGKPILTPYYQLCRLIKTFSRGRGKNAVSRVTAACRQSQDAISTVSDLFEAVGLHKTNEVSE